MQNLVNKIVLGVNLIFVLLLVIATFSGFVSPATSLGHLFYIASLGFSILVIVNIIFAVYWGLRSNPNFGYSSIALILALTIVNSYFRFNPFESQKVSAPARVRILTYNIQGNQFLGSTQSKRAKLFDFLNNRDVDIICLQELYLDNRTRNPFTLNHIKAMLSRYNYVYFEPNIDGLTVYGNLIASKYPLENIRYFKFKKTSNSAMFADLTYGKHKVLLINAHLESNRLDPLKHDLYDELSMKNKSELKSEMKGVFKRLIEAADRRAGQADAIDMVIKESKLPVILCGDFNDTPASYTYRKFKYLGDAFCQGGGAFGATYNGKYPAFRIDYIFHDKRFEVQNYQKYKVNLSDHYPISAEIVIK